MKPTVNELFEIHKFEKQVLCTQKNPLDIQRVCQQTQE